MLVLSCRMADAGNYNSRSVQDFCNRRKSLQQKLHLQNGLMSHGNNILLSKWHLIENHPLLRERYREPPFISYMYRRGKSLTDILVKAKLLKRSKNYYIKKQQESCLACQHLLNPFSTSGVPPARSLDRTTVLSWIEIRRRNNSGSCTWQHFPGPSPGNLEP